MLRMGADQDNTPWFMSYLRKWFVEYFCCLKLTMSLEDDIVSFSCGNYCSGFIVSYQIHTCSTVEYRVVIIFLRLVQDRKILLQHYIKGMG